MWIRIEVDGILDEKWTEWFEGMKISHRKNKTFFEGKMKDQSALFGMLNRIRDLNLVLRSVKRVQEKGGDR